MSPSGSGWDGEPGTPGQAVSSFHAKESQEQEQRWQAGQPALEQKAAKLVLPSIGWKDCEQGGWDVAEGRGNAQL